MSFQALIFDVGGVLLHTRAGGRRQVWEERLGLPLGHLSKIVFGSEVSRQAGVGLVPESEVWVYMANFWGLSIQESQDLERDFWSDDGLNIPLVDLIQSLRPYYKIAALSNAWSGAREAFQAYGLHTLVDTMIISAEEGIAKPDEHIYRIAVQRLDVEAGNSIFVDDIAKNVQGARSVGMQGIQFQTTAQTIEELSKYLGLPS